MDTGLPEPANCKHHSGYRTQLSNDAVAQALGFKRVIPPLREGPGQVGIELLLANFTDLDLVSGRQSGGGFGRLYLESPGQKIRLQPMKAAEGGESFLRRGGEHPSEVNY